MIIKDQSYYVAGGRTGVLLMHGLCATPAEMRFLANGLACAGYTVYCPQLAGHGGTEADLEQTTWQDWYASAEEALVRLRTECDVVIVAGLSTGAMLALLLTARHADKVQGTALLAPTLWRNGWPVPWYARLFRIISSKHIANLIGFTDPHPHPDGIKDERIHDFIHNALLNGDGPAAGLPSMPGGAVLEHRRLVKALRTEIGNIRQPALIIHPREGDYAGLDNAWYLQRNLKGLVDAVVLDDSYHIVTVDRQRHLVVERTAAFVAHVAKAIVGQPSARVATPACKAA
jgi:carboxylesterase